MPMRSVSDKGGIVTCEALDPMCPFPEAQLTVTTGRVNTSECHGSNEGRLQLRRLG